MWLLRNIWNIDIMRSRDIISGDNLSNIQTFLHLWLCHTNRDVGRPFVTHTCGRLLTSVLCEASECCGSAEMKWFIVKCCPFLNVWAEVWAVKRRSSCRVHWRLVRDTRLVFQLWVWTVLTPNCVKLSLMSDWLSGFLEIRNINEMHVCVCLCVCVCVCVCVWSCSAPVNRNFADYFPLVLIQHDGW